MAETFVPSSFAVPHMYTGTGFHLEPLGPEHNERDYAAWMSSIDHIRSTPGFPHGGWPEPMSLEENLGDLEAHAQDFVERRGFTYSILDGLTVIGCVYIYPSRDEDHDAAIRSWVRASRAEMDRPVWKELSTWIADAWPFSQIDYAPR